MDLTLPADARDLRAVIDRLFERSAGPAQARRLRSAGGQSDGELLHRMEEELGWSSLLAGVDADSLVCQVQLAEACGANLVQLHVAAQATGAKLGGDGAFVPVRALHHVVRRPAELAGVITRSSFDGVVVHSIIDAVTARAGWGEPVGRVRVDRGFPHGGAPFERVVAWHRLLLAAEGVGAAARALATTVDHCVNREQFGAPIASRQAVRHRLAELQSDVESTRWLVLDAAAHGGHAGLTAMAATSLVGTASTLVSTLHRFTGAIGMADEHDLALFTGRLRAVVAELGPYHSLAVEVARARKELRR